MPWARPTQGGVDWLRAGRSRSRHRKLNSTWAGWRTASWPSALQRVVNQARPAMALACTGGQPALSRRSGVVAATEPAQSCGPGASLHAEVSTRPGAGDETLGLPRATNAPNPSPSFEQAGPAGTGVCRRMGVCWRHVWPATGRNGYCLRRPVTLGDLSDPLANVKARFGTTIGRKRGLNTVRSPNSQVKHGLGRLAKSRAQGRNQAELFDSHGPQAVAADDPARPRLDTGEGHPR